MVSADDSVRFTVALGGDDEGIEPFEEFKPEEAAPEAPAENEAAEAPEAEKTEAEAEAEPAAPAKESAEEDEGDLNALLKLFEDEEQSSVALGDDDDAVTAFGTKYDGMTDEELMQHFRALTPKQLRAELGNGHAMQSRFQQELQRQRQLTMDLERKVAELDSRLASTAARPSADGESDRRLTEKDLFDEDGNYRPGMLPKLIEQEVQAALRPVQETMTERERAEQRRQQEELERKLLAAERQLKAAIPMLRSPERMRRIYEYMQRNNILDMKAACAAVYPVEYAKAVMRYHTAKTRQKKATPVTPGNATSKATEKAPSMDDRDQFVQYLAKKAAEVMGRT